MSWLEVLLDGVAGTAAVGVLSVVIAVRLARREQISEAARDVSQRESERNLAREQASMAAAEAMVECLTNLLARLEDIIEGAPQEEPRSRRIRVAVRDLTHLVAVKMPAILDAEVRRNLTEVERLMSSFRDFWAERERQAEAARASEHRPTADLLEPTADRHFAVAYTAANLTLASYVGVLNAYRRGETPNVPLGLWLPDAAAGPLLVEPA